MSATSRNGLTASCLTAWVRTIIPTTEAELLYPRALAILDDLRKLADDLTAVGTRVSGKIVIAASTIPSAFVLPGMAADFNTTYPDISFEIRTSSSAQVIDAVLNNEILLGVVGATSSNSKLNFRAFKKDTLVLAASTKMIVDQPVTTTTLLGLPFIMREQGSGTRKSMERFLAEKDIKLSQLNTRAVFGSSTAVCEAVKANLGVSILSSHAIKDSVKNGQIQVIEIYNLPMIRNFYTVTTKKRSLPRHYQAFLQQLLAHEDSLHDSV